MTSPSNGDAGAPAPGEEGNNQAISTAGHSFATEDTNDTQIVRNDAAEASNEDLFAYEGEFQTLTPEQVKKAKVLVAKHHPLSRLPLSEALPFLKVFTCCCKQVNESREDEYARLLEGVYEDQAQSFISESNDMVAEAKEGEENR